MPKLVATPKANPNTAEVVIVAVDGVVSYRTTGTVIVRHFPIEKPSPTVKVRTW